MLIRKNQYIDCWESRQISNENRFENAKLSLNKAVSHHWKMFAFKILFPPKTIKTLAFAESVEFLLTSELAGWLFAIY